MQDQEERGRKKVCLKWVSSTEQGREFLWDMLSYCGVYQEVEGDHNQVLRGLGRRQVGLHLMGLLSDADEEIIFTMMKEARKRHQERELKNERANNRTNNRTNQPRSIDDFFGNGSDDGSDVSGYSNGGAIF